MNLLLDTHTLLWWLAGDDLAPAAAEAVADPANVVAVSAASIWEAAINQSLGKLRIDGDLPAAVRQGGFEALPISFAHAAEVGRLPAHHRDPFDRMLVAQAVLEGLTVVTRDPVFGAYGVPVLAA